jgi:hypothetical protein
LQNGSSRRLSREDGMVFPKSENSARDVTASGFCEAVSLLNVGIAHDFGKAMGSTEDLWSPEKDEDEKAEEMKKTSANLVTFR